MTIILVLMSVYYFYPKDIGGVGSTRSDIMRIEMALIEYKSRYGVYPLDTRTGAVNLSDDTDAEVKKVIVELLKIESFHTNENGVPIDSWGNPIYFIARKNYESSPLAASIPNISEKVFYNPNSFQLVSGGPDGTETSLGAAEDNVANYPKN